MSKFNIYYCLVIAMYEDVIILSVSSVLSLIIILYSAMSMNKELKGLLSYGVVTHPPIVEGVDYITRKKELEYLKEILQSTIARVYKEYEEGRISEDEKNKLVSKFRVRLMDVDKELNEVSLYAELESLEKEYKKLVEDFERRKKELEERIQKLKSRIQVKKERKKRVEEAVKPKEASSKPARARASRESELSELMEELSEIMKKLEEGEE